MLEAGEDPLYVARRLVRFASEDVGLADPHALVQAMAAQQAVHFVGLPEGSLALAQAVVYLAAAPKSNALYTAYTAAARDALETRAEPVPLWIRNAPTPLMKQLGYGKGYRYATTSRRAFRAWTACPKRWRESATTSRRRAARSPASPSAWTQPAASKKRRRGSSYSSSNSFRSARRSPGESCLASRSSGRTAAGSSGVGATRTRPITYRASVRNEI